MESTKLDSDIKTELEKVAASLSSLNNTFGNFGSVDFDSIVPTEKIEEVRGSFQEVRRVLNSTSLETEKHAIDEIIQSLDGLNGETKSIALLTLLVICSGIFLESSEWPKSYHYHPSSVCGDP